MRNTGIETCIHITINSNINIGIKIKFAIFLRITTRKISNQNGFIFQTGGLDSIWYGPSPEETPEQIANSTELLKLVKQMARMARMSIYMVFYKIKFLLAKKILLNSMCVPVKKSKTINILDVKLVKHSNIIKLENFNTAEDTILTNKYVR